MVWTGSQALIFGGAGGDMSATPIGGAVNPATGQWRTFPELEQFRGVAVTDAFWSGDRVILLGTQYQCDTFEPSGSFSPGQPGCERTNPFLGLLDPDSGELERIDDRVPPEVTTALANDVPMVWTGQELMWFETRGTKPTLLFDPIDNSVRPGAPPPCQTVEIASDGPPEYWGSPSVLMTCEDSTTAVYQPSANTWTVVPGTQDPVLYGPAVAWSDTQMFVWSGTALAVDNPTPNAGVLFTFG